MVLVRPEKLTSDSGPRFVAQKKKVFLNAWGVRYRVTSAYLPHANLRGEEVVHTVKRLLRGNVRPSGSLDCDMVARALLNYMDTPDRDLERSPVQIGAH